MKFKQRAAEGAVLLTAAAVVYGLLLSGPLVYDDEIYASPGRVLNWRALFSRDYFALTDERSFQPLVTALQLVAGNAVDALRVGAILLHAANAVLVAALGRAMGISPPAAFAAAILFVLFPPATEAVSIVSFSGHLWVCFATLAAMQAWRRGRHGLSLAALGLGFLSKESAVMIGPLLLGLELFYPSKETARARRALAGAAALTAAYLFFRFFILAPASAVPLPPPSAPASIMGWYFKSVALPWPLCLERTAAEATAWPFVLWTVGAAFLFARGRIFALWLWPAVALLPVLHLVPFANYSPVADRYLYAAAGPAALFLCAWLYGPRGRILLALLALAWGAGSVRRTAFFREPGNLYRQTAQCAPSNPRAHALLASWQYRAENRADLAFPNFEKAFALDPMMTSHFAEPGLTHRQPPDYVRGTLLLRLSRPAEAETLLSAALRAAADPVTEGAVRSRRGDALAALGREEEAIAEQRKAAALLPGWVMPPLKLAILHMDADPTAALTYAESALPLAPANTVAARILSVIGDAHWRLNDKIKAEAAWRKSRELERSEIR